MGEKLDTYQDCVNVLNTLSTTLEKSLYEKQLSLMEGFLDRVGLPLKTLDQLSVIHIAGTKGKGSTCAFTEKILREHKLKTGFSSGPPLIEVRERFRINGVSISREEFQKYFKEVYTKLKTTAREHQEQDMPNYRCFIFILAFVIFVDKKVDVAVIETGIGGMYDGSNVLRKVPVVGITSLDIDHKSLLGSTIDKIAEHKAGIMKEHCQAFTVTQDESAMAVLNYQSHIKQCPLIVTNGLAYDTVFEEDSAGETWKLNASLAVELSKAWLDHHNNKAKINGKETKEWNNEITKRALKDAYWPGRFDTQKVDNVTYYLDGAHTRKSIAIAVRWFVKHTKNSHNKKVLMFNITGERVVEDLIEPFSECNFDLVYFVPHIPRLPLSADVIPYGSQEMLLKRCEENKMAWIEKETCKTKTLNSFVFQTIEEAIETFKKGQNQYDVLVTGSVRLVGGVFNVIKHNVYDL